MRGEPAVDDDGLKLERVRVNEAVGAADASPENSAGHGVGMVEEPDTRSTPTLRNGRTCQSCSARGVSSLVEESPDVTLEDSRLARHGRMLRLRWTRVRL